MAWTCAECGEQFLFDAPSKWQPDAADEDGGPVCSDCRE